MMITKKALSRRTILRGLGASVALPLLDGMVPAFAGVLDPTRTRTKRVSVMYVPQGQNMAEWTPATEGAGFEFSRVIKPLEPFRDHVLVLTGLDNDPGRSRLGEPGSGHARAPASFMTGMHPKATQGADVECGISLDQVAAAAFGRETELPSLELGLDAAEYAGGCENGYNCLYTTTLSWRNPTTPIMGEHNPRLVFERLFGDDPSTDAAARRSRMEREGSLLDVLTQDLTRLRRQLGPTDQSLLGEYVEAIRDVERRIQKAEQASNRELPTVDQPMGVPESFDDYAKLMFDLQLLAFQADLTRVISFMIGKELSNRTYPQVGVRDAHHVVSHHNDRPEVLDQQSRIGSYHLSLLAYYLDKLRATPDGEGTLLDSVMIMYGSGMGNSSLHLALNLPILLLGGGAGQLKGGRHLRYPKGTPLANLHRAMLAKLGLPKDNWGDSTGELAL